MAGPCHVALEHADGTTNSVHPSLAGRYDPDGAVRTLTRPYTPRVKTTHPGCHQFYRPPLRARQPAISQDFTLTTLGESLTQRPPSIVRTRRPPSRYLRVGSCG